MLSLYEILKASKTGIASDMWTALAGMNWGGADSGHEVKELTGIPPLSFTADGTPLLDYLISGNMSQTGTPSPQNPVMPNGVGERTKNLLKNDAVSTEFRGVQYTVNADKSVTVYGTAGTQISYFILIGDGAATNDLSAYTTPIFKAGDTLKFSSGSSICKLLGRNTNGTYVNVLDGTVTLSKDLGLIYIQVANGATADETVYPMITLSTETNTDYEPYGFKIPISSGQQTTNIYLGNTQTTRRIKKLVLDGTENITSGHLDVSLFNIPVTGYLRDLSATIVACTHYKAQKNVSGWLEPQPNVCTFYAGTAQSNLMYIRDTRYTTIEEFKAYLAAQYAAGTPVTVWHVLATAETTTVNEPLMKIGNYADTVSMEQAGVSIPTLNGQTVVDVETTLKPSQMYIKYWE